MYKLFLYYASTFKVLHFKMDICMQKRVAARVSNHFSIFQSTICRTQKAAVLAEHSTIEIKYNYTVDKQCTHVHASASHTPPLHGGVHCSPLSFPGGKIGEEPPHQVFAPASSSLALFRAASRVVTYFSWRVRENSM